MREAYRALEREQALIVFPAGEVSRVGAQGVRDAAWSSGFVRLATKTKAPVLPVHIAAYNSPVFYGASMLAKPLATLLLAREVFGAAHARIGFSLGATVSAIELGRSKLPPTQVAQHMRRHIYRLAKRRPTAFVTENAIAHPESPLAVKRALVRGEMLGETTDGKRILLIDAIPDCPVMREIGRLRELSFRRVGEGTGMRRDLDRYDAHYKHLVLWDEHALAIVGAYRLGELADILQRHGMSGLYSASLFDYSAKAQEFLVDGVELGRSFVQPAYWGSRSLDYLWQGIGAYLRHRPHLRYLFGPVSLSAALPSTAREWIAHCHLHYFGDRETLVQARNPFLVSEPIAREASRAWLGRDSKAGLQALKECLLRNGTGLPVLYRQYVDLCEPDGVRFLAFGEDPAFGHCVDGLIRLDLARLKPAKRSRYLGCPSEL
jgi:putative hemolysin